MTELIRTIGGVAGSIISVITLLTLAVKPMRDGFRRWIYQIAAQSDDHVSRKDMMEIKSILIKDTTKEEREEIVRNSMDIKDILQHQSEQNEQILCELEDTKSDMTILKDSTRSTIKNMISSIYNTGRVTKKISANDRESLVHLYETYHALGGNNYTTIIYNEMLEWDVEG